MSKDTISKLLETYNSERFSITQFHKRLINFFSDNPVLSKTEFPIIHSLKYRLKSQDHIVEKIERKNKSGYSITTDNLFEKITDFAGIRILHLYPSDFEKIHSEIKKQIDEQEWYLFEPPVAYTWDPELQTIFQKLEIITQIKESYYTSVHYVLMPKEKSHIKCEIQVRTLFEEIWGEIDHSMNYPHQMQSVACKEQLKVLSGLSSTGSRLLESILKAREEFDYCLQKSQKSE